MFNKDLAINLIYDISDIVQKGELEPILSLINKCEGDEKDKLIAVRQVGYLFPKTIGNSFDFLIEGVLRRMFRVRGSSIVISVQPGVVEVISYLKRLYNADKNTGKNATIGKVDAATLIARSYVILEPNTMYEISDYKDFLLEHMDSTEVNVVQALGIAFIRMLLSKEPILEDILAEVDTEFISCHEEDDLSREYVISDRDYDYNRLGISLLLCK